MNPNPKNSEHQNKRLIGKYLLEEALQRPGGREAMDVHQRWEGLDKAAQPHQKVMNAKNITPVVADTSGIIVRQIV